MKRGMQSGVIVAALLLGAATFLAGCASTGMDRAKKTTNMMQTVEGDCKAASAQIDATNGSLANLVRQDQSDRRKAYNVYTKDVEKMEKLGAKLDKHADAMRSGGNDYYMQWETGYTNPEIRELSERRRIEMRELYAQVPEAGIGVKGALQSYLTDIREIQKYLSNDLTPQGVDTIRPVSERAVKDGEGTKESVNKVLAAIDRIRVEMMHGGAAAK